MNRRHVVLDISPSRLELAIVAGRDVVSSHVHPFAADLLDNWPASLAAVRPVLLEWVGRYLLDGRPTTILYSSPDAHAGVFAVPAGLGAGAARQAAGLALADAVGFPLDHNPFAIAPLGTGGGGAGSPLQLLGVADTDESISALHVAATAAGLRVEAIIPAAAAQIAATVREAAGASSAEGTTLLLHLGEHGSVLAAVSGGRTRFVRSFAVGVGSFVDALRRPISCRHAGETSLCLGQEEARDILFGSGVPRREEVIDAQRGIDGAALLPLLQPVLQRCAVEVKQSLRFGLDEGERGTVHLRLLGLGRCIPRLGEAIAELHGEPLSACSSEAAGDAPSASPPTSAAHGPAAALLTSGCAVHLLPREVQSTRTARALGRAVWAGIAAAAVIVGVDGAMTHLSLRAEASRAASPAAVETESPILRIYEQALAARTGVAATKGRIESAMGGVSDWGVLLLTLADVTPAEVRLRSIDLVDEPGETLRCRLRAAAAPGDAAGAPIVIKQYLDALREVPLVADVRLGATGRTVVDGGTVHEFELFCDLVPLPAAPSLAAAPAQEPSR